MSLRRKNKLYPLKLSSLVLALALGACGDDSGDDGTGNDDDKADSGTSTPREDAGRDAGGSSPMDGGGGGNTKPDSATNNPGDSGTPGETKPDASTDASTRNDSGTDSGTADAGNTVIETLNGCKPTDYTDKSGNEAAVIKFGVGGMLKYEPKCTTIKVGQKVRFEGSFTNHPLAKGTPGDANAGTAGNPIAATMMGDSKEFTFSAAGTFPYYCTRHDGQGMVGSIHVK